MPAFGQAGPEGAAGQVEACVLGVSPAVRVLAVHDLRLTGVQLEPRGPGPLGKRGPQFERFPQPFPSVPQWATTSSAYAEDRIMPSWMPDALVRVVGGVLLSA
jgi:hypothetical protein